MAIKENLEKWTAAMQSFDELRLEESLSRFQQFADISKIHFNVGMVSQRLRYTEEARDAYSMAISQDSFFAAAYFQRGNLLFYDDDIEGALADYQDCFEKLRGNTHINYSQLGLEYVLQECYIILNISLCFIALEEYDTGLRYMDQALKASQTATIRPDTSKIEDALRNGEAADGKVLPYEIPENLIFRPQEDNIKNAKKVDYLGKSKIVAGADKGDNFNGFSGRQQKEMTLGRDYRKKSAPNTNEPDSLNASAIKLDTISRRPSTSNASAAGLPRSNSINSLHSRKPSEDFLPSPQRSPIVTRRPSAATSVGGNEPPASPSKRVFGRRTSSFRGAPTTGADKTLPLPISTSQSVESQIFRDELSDSPSPIGGGTSASYRGGDYGYGDTMKLPRRGTESSINPPASEISFSESSSMDDKIRVKAYYNGCRFVHVPFDASYEILLSAVCTKFRNQNLLLKFMDEGGRKTIMSNDDDLAEALDLAEEEGRLEVWCFVPAM